MFEQFDSKFANQYAVWQISNAIFAVKFYDFFDIFGK
jgi:hypothetical protein